MEKKLTDFINLVKQDPAVDTVVGFTGGGQTNGGMIFAALKPKAERKLSADQVMARLRPQLNQVAGARLFMQPVQDIRIGGRQGNSLYQYTLQSDSVQELYTWAPKLTEALQRLPTLTDVNSDQQQNGLEVDLTIDRDTASRLGLTPTAIDNTLYDAFGQRTVSTIYNALNQYHVVMEVAPQFWQSPDTLQNLWVSTSGGAVSGSASSNAVAGTVTSSQTESNTSAAALANNAARNLATNRLASSGGSASTGAAVSTAAASMVPLAAFSHYGPGNTPLSINHQGPFVATTISFNLAENVSLSEATAAIRNAENQIGMPSTIHGSFQGTARSFQQSLDNQPMLILAALVAVYIVLGVLYESFIHPITILSTLPSAGAGAVLALRLFNLDFSLIALIGVILLIGIVKKNAIMMIDFALDAQRHQGLSPADAIYAAATLRFRPIMMTTMAALLGALPLALGTGDGAEMRQPLGVAIVGGLIVSQALTLYTTPVIYLYMDHFGRWCRQVWQRFYHPAQPASAFGASLGESSGP